MCPSCLDCDGALYVVKYVLNITGYVSNTFPNTIKLYVSFLCHIESYTRQVAHASYNIDMFCNVCQTTRAYIYSIFSTNVTY